MELNPLRLVQATKRRFVPNASPRWRRRVAGTVLAIGKKNSEISLSCAVHEMIVLFFFFFLAENVEAE
jgi:hypothetical protein